MSIQVLHSVTPNSELLLATFKMKDAKEQIMKVEEYDWLLLRYSLYFLHTSGIRT